MAFAAIGFALAMQQGAVLNVNAPRLKITQERVLSGDGESFDDILSLALGPSGDVFAYDQIQKRIVHLDKNGQLIGQLGGADVDLESSSFRPDSESLVTLSGLGISCSGGSPSMTSPASS